MAAPRRYSISGCGSITEALNRCKTWRPGSSALKDADDRAIPRNVGRFRPGCRRRPPARARSEADFGPAAARLPHPRQLALALIALVVATAATLVVPVAVRRIIDHGFSNAHRDLINQYFAVMLLVVAVLAVASASRFYFVSWLGERSVADLRDKVFAHLLDLSPAFYDTAMTGEVMSRLTADTLQIKTLFSSAASIALRNSLMLAGAIAMMLVTSLRLSGLVLLAIPLIVLPLVLFGREVRRLSREAQDALAGSAALAQESLGTTFRRSRPPARSRGSASNLPTRPSAPFSPPAAAPSPARS